MFPLVPASLITHVLSLLARLSFSQPSSHILAMLSIPLKFAVATSLTLLRASAL